MTKVVAYTRGSGGVRGAQDSISFWRRVRLPLTQLAQQGLFLSFEIMDLAPDVDLEASMLLGPDIVVLHNFVPRSVNEFYAFSEAALGARQSGRILTLVYDLEDPALLQREWVLTLLPLMRLITVANQYLADEVETLSRVSMQHIEEVPSTFDLVACNYATQKYRNQARDYETECLSLGCLGDHDWERFLPPLFEALRARLLPEQYATILVSTDRSVVATICIKYQIFCHQVGNDEGLSLSGYLRTLARCHVGLLPREGIDGRDNSMQWEYGSMDCPVLAATSSCYDVPDAERAGCIVLPLADPERWAIILAHWLTSKEGEDERRQKGSRAFENALRHRVALQTKHFAQVYRQILPLSHSSY